MEDLGYRAYALAPDAKTVPFDRSDLSDPRKLLDVVFKPV